MPDSQRITKIFFNWLKVSSLAFEIIATGLELHLLLNSSMISKACHLQPTLACSCQKLLWKWKEEHVQCIAAVFIFLSCCVSHLYIFHYLQMKNQYAIWRWSTVIGQQTKALFCQVSWENSVSSHLLYLHTT